MSIVTSENSRRDSSITVFCGIPVQGKKWRPMVAASLANASGLHAHLPEKE